VICLDEMGPERAKSYLGVRVAARAAEVTRRPRARQEIDYGRPGSGYTFGACRPATGDAFTAPYGGRSIAIKRSRIGEILQAEGLRWRTEETWFGERLDPAFAEKRGPSSPSTMRRPVAAS